MILKLIKFDRLTREKRQERERGTIGNDGTE